jgi:predicted RNA-binding protein YlxR (DUF448 family)
MATPHQALRRCAATGRVRPQAELLRFAVVGGQVAPDVLGRAGGRGLWLSPGRDMIRTASARNLFTRGRGRARPSGSPIAKVAVPADLAERAEAALVRHCLDLAGLALRAREAVAESSQVDDWTASGKAAVLVEGSGLGAATGTKECRRVAVKAGPFARRLEAEARRLAGFGGTKIETAAGCLRIEF